MFQGPEKFKIRFVSKRLTHPGHEGPFWSKLYEGA